MRKTGNRGKVTVSEMVNWLDRQFASMIPLVGEDFSRNGLQVDGRFPVGGKDAPLTKVAYAVDACQNSIDEAVKKGAQLLVVHHGLFWGKGLENMTGINAARIGGLLRNQISLYGMHLPLDGHRTMGHNARLAQLLGMRVVDWIENIGCVATVKKGKGVSLDDVMKSLRKILVQTAPLQIVADGGTPIRRVAIISGSGASMISQAKASGCDLLLTGEVSHSMVHEVRESGMSVIEAGHYATEIIGLRALAAEAQKSYPQISWTEIACDTRH